MNFIEVARLGYAKALVPVVPPNAEISARSKAVRAITKGRGKVPGKKLSDGWVGFPKWEQYAAGMVDFQTWAGWGAGVGLKTADFPAFDVDVLDAGASATIQALICERLGATPPLRVGRAPKGMLLCRAADGSLHTKRKLRFTLPGSDVEHAVELLGDGQYFVVAGEHPTTNQPYAWPRALTKAADLPELTTDTVDAIFAEIQEFVEMIGGAVKKSAAAPTVTGQDALLAPDTEAVRAALTAIPNDVSYDEWVAMGAAIKAATGGDGLDIWHEWSSQYAGNDVDDVQEKWSTFKPPFRIGWAYIAERAAANGFDAAQYDFDEVEEEEAEQTPEGVLDLLVKDNIWIERTKQAFDTRTRRMRDREQFNIHNNHIGAPHSRTVSAWAQWSEREDIQRANSLTYRPGGSLIVDEPAGKCVNTWTPSTLKPREGDVTPWLEHVAYLLPDEEQREVFLSWLAYLLQLPGEKPQWAVVLGGGEGIGKDMLLQPVIAALGQHNVSTVSPEMMAGSFSDWYGSARLIVVEEMMNFERKEQSNKLKQYLSGYPAFVPVNKKFVPTYEVPNIGAFIFFTNHEDALAVSKEDRRYHVLWSDAAPKIDGYYLDLVAWYEADGFAHVADWLSRRDISAFRRMSRPPMTEAKSVMHRSTLTPVEAWLAEGMENEDGLLAQDLVTVKEVMAAAVNATGAKGVTAARMAIWLKRAGACSLGQQRLSDDERVRLYSLRRHAIYAALSPKERAPLYEKQRSEGAEAIFANAK